MALKCILIGCFHTGKGPCHCMSMLLSYRVYHCYGKSECAHIQCTDSPTETAMLHLSATCQAQAGAGVGTEAGDETESGGEAGGEIEAGAEAGAEARGEAKAKLMQRQELRRG